MIRSGCYLKISLPKIQGIGVVELCVGMKFKTFSKWFKRFFSFINHLFLIGSSIRTSRKTPTQIRSIQAIKILSRRHAMWHVINLVFDSSPFLLQPHRPMLGTIYHQVYPICGRLMVYTSHLCHNRDCVRYEIPEISNWKQYGFMDCK